MVPSLRLALQHLSLSCMLSQLSWPESADLRGHSLSGLESIAAFAARKLGAQRGLCDSLPAIN